MGGAGVGTLTGQPAACPSDNSAPETLGGRKRQEGWQVALRECGATPLASVQRRFKQQTIRPPRHRQVRPRATPHPQKGALRQGPLRHARRPAVDNPLVVRRNVFMVGRGSPSSAEGCHSSAASMVSAAGMSAGGGASAAGATPAIRATAAAPPSPHDAVAATARSPRVAQISRMSRAR